MKNMIIIGSCLLALIVGTTSCKEDSGTALQGISLDQVTGLTVARGKSIKITATPVPEGADYGGSFVFYVDDFTRPGVTPTVTVAADGTITGAGVGQSIVYVRDANNTVQYPFQVTSYVELEDFTIPETATINVGDMLPLVPTPVPADASIASITYASSNAAVATVSTSGQVTGVGAGTAVITASAGTVNRQMNLEVKSGIVIPDAAGVWLFDNPNDLAAAAAGNPLTIVGTVTSIPGPKTGDLAINVPVSVPPSVYNHLLVDHGLTDVASDGLVHTYSIMMDISVPFGGYHSLIQTDLANTSDGDIFVRDTQIGVGTLGYTAAESLPYNSWHRVVITVSALADGNNEIRAYIDGVFWPFPAEKGNGINSNPRFCLDPAGVILYGDESGEDLEINVAEVRIWDKTLSPAQVGELGGVPTE